MHFVVLVYESLSYLIPVGRDQVNSHMLDIVKYLFHSLLNLTSISKYVNRVKFWALTRQFINHAFLQFKGFLSGCVLLGDDILDLVWKLIQPVNGDCNLCEVQITLVIWPLYVKYLSFRICTLLYVLHKMGFLGWLLLGVMSFDIWIYRSLCLWLSAMRYSLIGIWRVSTRNA